MRSREPATVTSSPIRARSAGSRLEVEHGLSFRGTQLSVYDADEKDYLTDVIIQGNWSKDSDGWWNSGSENDQLSLKPEFEAGDKRLTCQNFDFNQSKFFNGSASWPMKDLPKFGEKPTRHWFFTCAGACPFKWLNTAGGQTGNSGDGTDSGATVLFPTSKSTSGPIYLMAKSSAPAGQTVYRDYAAVTFSDKETGDGTNGQVYTPSNHSSPNSLVD